MLKWVLHDKLEVDGVKRDKLLLSTKAGVFYLMFIGVNCGWYNGLK